MWREVCAITSDLSTPFSSGHIRDLSQELKFGQWFPDGLHRTRFASPDPGSAAEEAALELGLNQ